MCKCVFFISKKTIRSVSRQKKKAPQKKQREQITCRMSLLLLKRRGQKGRRRRANEARFLKDATMKRKDEQEEGRERGRFVVGFDRERGRYLFRAHSSEIEWNRCEILVPGE